MGDYYTLLTDTGLAKDASANAGGAPLEFHEIVVGTGNGDDYYSNYDKQQLQSLTALLDPVWSSQINVLYVDDNNPRWVVMEASIPASEGGFTIREVGVKDVHGDLVGVGRYPKTYKPTLNEGASQELLIRFILEVTNADNITLNIDPAVVMASRKWVEKQGVALAIKNAPAQAPGNGDFLGLVDADNGPSLKQVSLETLKEEVENHISISHWVERTGPNSYQWKGITWSPDIEIFCAVSSAGDVMTSSDGINWTEQTASAEISWQSVTWSPELGLFCAVSSGGTNRVMTSPNGTDWTSQTTIDEGDWMSVTWSPQLNLFCAVADNGSDRVMTSPDGVNWTARAAAADATWKCVTWSAGLNLFCAVAETGAANVMTSPDGINWTVQPGAHNGYWRSITWSEQLGLFCATGRTSPYVMTSPDGINWSTQSVPESNDWMSVVWSPEYRVFCAIAGTGDNRVMISPDGESWKAIPAPNTNYWINLTWSPKLRRFCAVSTNVSSNPVMTNFAFV